MVWRHCLRNEQMETAIQSFYFHFYVHKNFIFKTTIATSSSETETAGKREKVKPIRCELTQLIYYIFRDESSFMYVISAITS